MGLEGLGLRLLGVALGLLGLRVLVPGLLLGPLPLLLHGMQPLNLLQSCKDMPLSIRLSCETMAMTPKAIQHLSALLCPLCSTLVLGTAEISF